MSEVPANPFAAPDDRPPDPASALTPSSDLGGSPYGQPMGGVPDYGTPTYGSHGAPPFGPYAEPSYGPPGGAYPPSPYGSSGYPPPPYGYPHAPQESSNGLAIASMIVGIASVALCMFFVPAVVGLVLGIIALGQTKNGSSGGRGMAITGVVTSAVSLVLAVVFVIIGLVAESSTYDEYDYYSTQGPTGQVTGDDALAGLVTA